MCLFELWISQVICSPIKKLKKKNNKETPQKIYAELPSDLAIPLLAETPKDRQQCPEEAIVHSCSYMHYSQ